MFALSSLGVVPMDQNGTAIGGAIYGSILVAGVGFEPTTFWL